MKKRIYKLSELLEEMVFTQADITFACLSGGIPVYNQEGLPLLRVQIPVTCQFKNNKKHCSNYKCTDIIPRQFLCDITFTTTQKKGPEKLYNNYEEIKEFLVYKDNVLSYLSGMHKEIKPLVWTGEYYINLAKEKLAASTNQEVKPDNLLVKADIDLNPRSRNTLYKVIIGLARLGSIDLAESGLADSLNWATKAAGCEVPISTIYKYLSEITKYQSQIKS